MAEKRQFAVIESRQMDHLRVFHEVARALTQTLELEEILQTIMEKMRQFFNPERWSMLMVDEKAQQLYYAIAVGEDAESLRGLRIPLGEGVAGWVAATGNSLVVPDVSIDTQWSAFARAHPELKIQSIACVPVRAGDQTLGVIQLLNSKLDLLSEYSISFLRILCDYAAIAIQNARSVDLIHQLTITDDCTGLFNARHLYTMLDELVAESGMAFKKQFSLVFIDLDRFKQVNDTWGHAAGDALLLAVAERLRACLRPQDTVARFGGDEFALVLDEAGSVEDIDCLARRIQLDMQRPVEIGQGEVCVSASMGIALGSTAYNDVEDILRDADAAMYRAKEMGRARHEFFVAPATLPKGMPSVLRSNSEAA